MDPNLSLRYSAFHLVWWPDFRFTSICWIQL